MLGFVLEDPRDLRAEFAGDIARILAETVRLRPGNYLAFFSSFAYRDEVVAKLPKRPRDFELLLQLPNTTVAVAEG